MMRKITLLLAFALLTAFQIVQAQTVTGRVTSKDEPLGIPGVAVQIKGTTTGTTTDLDGKFSLSVSQGQTLVFTYAGMKTQEVVVANQPNIDVLMESSTTAIEGVTISGYGVTRKSGASAQARVGGDAIKVQTEANVANSLQGAVPGLQVSSSNGSPGSAATVKLRGTSNMGNSSSQPLYIVDGVPIAVGNFSSRGNTSTDPLATINPDDIESISVLKDASATSIYGARAANGVILITTKKGKEGLSSLVFSAKVGVSTSPFIPKKFRMLDADDYKTLMIEGYKNAKGGTTENAINKLTSGKTPLWDKNADVSTDWVKEVTKVGSIQEYNLSTSGGNDKTTYYLSGGYYKEDGFIIGTGYERYSARLNLDHQVRDYIKIGMSMSGAYAHQDQISGGLAYANPYFLARGSRPTAPVYKSNGEWYDSASYSKAGYNAVALKQDPYGDEFYNDQYKAILSPYITINILKNLVFQTKLGADVTHIEEKQSWSQTVNPQGKDMEGYASRYDFTRGNIIFTNTLNFFPEFKDKNHNLNVLLGQEAQKISDYDALMQARGFAHPSMTELGTAAIPISIYTGRSYATLASYFTNVEYDYKSKYYLSASARLDGSSRIGADNQWGMFYSVAGKYRISEENFMAGTKEWLNNLSLRLSYGTTGNQDIGWYIARSTYGLTESYAEQVASFPASPGNSGLVWESQNILNFGLEATLFDRLSIEMDVYDEFATNNLFNKPVSMVSGFETMIDNVGKLRNTGVELQLNYQIMSNKNFQWTANLNITANKNKIVALPNDNQSFAVGDIGWKEVGRQWNTLWLIEDDGINPENGKIWFKDSTGVGHTYDAKDAKKSLYDSDPMFYGGFGTNMKYKGFDFGMSFFYSVGNKYYSNDVYYYEISQANDGANLDYYYFDNRVKTAGDGGTMPIFTFDASSSGIASASVMGTTRQLMNGSYLRLKSVVLGYTLPKDLVTKWTLSNVRVYVSADNLITFTHKDFRGFDPDSGLSPVQAANNPSPRNFTAGVTVNF